MKNIVSIGGKRYEMGEPGTVAWEIRNPNGTPAPACGLEPFNALVGAYVLTGDKRYLGQVGGVSG